MDTSYPISSPRTGGPINTGASHQRRSHHEATFSGHSTNLSQPLQPAVEYTSNQFTSPEPRPLSSFGVSAANVPVRQASPDEPAPFSRERSHFSTDTAIPTAAKVAREHDDIPELSSSAYVPPSFNDDDEFYMLYLRRDGDSPPGYLRQDTIESLNLDHPGIFDGLDDVSDLFRDPARYQPLAKRIHNPDNIGYILENNNRQILWRAAKMTYGVYKYGCYQVLRDNKGQKYIKIEHDRYNAIKKDILNNHVDQLRSSLASTNI